MYRLLVHSRVRAAFEQINAGDWRAVAKGTSADIRHVAYGAHALSGERHSRGAFELWLQRLLLLFPGLQFEVTRVASRGGPWNTWAVAEWVDRATLVDGSHYENSGVSWVNVRWGKVCEIREYMDTELVADACRRTAASGIADAAAEPVVG